MKRRPSDWEQLIKDYHKTNAYIEWQKRKWITPPDERNKNEETRKQTPSEKPDGKPRN